MIKERYEFEIVTTSNGKEFKRKSKRYAYNKEHAEELLRKACKVKIKSIKLISQDKLTNFDRKNEIKSVSKKICNMSFCKSLDFKKGWCEKHYKEIFES